MADDLESFWEAVRVRSPIRLFSNRPSDFAEQLTLAAEKAGFDLKSRTRYRGKPLTDDLLNEILSDGVRTFLQHWAEALRTQNLAGVVEIVMEGHKLPPDEMYAFVRCLPSSLLERIAKSVVGSFTGVHALIACEDARRQGVATDLRVVAEGARTLVSFVDHNGQQVKFFLDDPFEFQPGQNPVPNQR